jgi:hypothetical protein
MSQMPPLPLPLLAAAVCSWPFWAPTNVAGQTDQGWQPAVIVVRHGEDRDPFIGATDPSNEALSDWKKNWAANWPNYTLPNGTSVQVRQHGLSSDGEHQAEFLAKTLPALLATNKFLPVTRVITKDPYTPNEKNEWPTPNPFDTAWPFIISNNITDVMLIKAEKGTNAYGPLAGQINKTVDKDLLAMLPYYHRSPEKFADSILPTNAQGIPTGSTLIVWDGQGMWGPHKTDGWYWGDDIPAPEGGTGKYDTNDGANILRLLGGLKIGNDIRDNIKSKGGTLPKKMARMYIFYPRFGTGPLATNEAPAIIETNIQIEQQDAGVTNTRVIPPKYDLMIWDPVGITNGWTNTVNFEINEADETETSSSDN